MSAAPARNPQASRTVGLVILGSAIALGTFSALTYAGVLPIAEDVRGWVSAGTGIVALADVAIGLFFLRAASQS